MSIDGRRIDLGNIDVPILNIMAEYDHLVPVESAKPLAKAISSSRYEEIVFPSSHVGLSVSAKAHEELWPKVTQWIEENHVG